MLQDGRPKLLGPSSDVVARLTGRKAAGNEA
jgi:hypothetical protein